VAVWLSACASGEPTPPGSCAYGHAGLGAMVPLESDHYKARNFLLNRPPLECFRLGGF
jgi:hypothetical protein